MGPYFWTETQRCFLTLISSTIFYSYHTIKSICFSVCSNILHIFHVIRLYHICSVHISDISNISVAHAVNTWVPCPFLVPPGSRGSNEVPVPAVRYSKTFIDASVEEVDSPLGDCSRRSCSAPPGRAEEPFLVSEEEYLNNLTEMLKDALNILKIWLKQNKHMAKVMNNDLLKSVWISI